MHEVDWFCKHMKKVRSRQAAILVLKWVKHSFSKWVLLNNFQPFQQASRKINTVGDRLNPILCVLFTSSRNKKQKHKRNTNKKADHFDSTIFSGLSVNIKETRTKKLITLIRQSFLALVLMKKGYTSCWWRKGLLHLRSHLLTCSSSGTNTESLQVA